MSLIDGRSTQTRPGVRVARQHDIEPDVVAASNALSGIGQPIAIIRDDERLDIWAPGAHTGTFRGKRPAFAAGAAAVVRVSGRASVASTASHAIGDFGVKELRC